MFITPKTNTILKKLYNTGSSSQYSEVELRSYFPFISDEEVLPHYRMKLLDRTEKIKRKFAGLVFDLQKDLKKNNTTLEDIISLAKLHYEQSEIDRLLNGCTTFTEAFGRLSKYFSFFNYSIIKLIVSKLNSTAIVKKLKKYKKAFREYSKLRICECPAGAFGSREDDEKVYVLKTEMKLNDSLEEYEKLQFEMNKVLGGKLLRLINVEEGCVQLTFRGFVEPELSLSKEDGQKVRDIGVLCLTYGDQVFDFSSLVRQKPAKPGNYRSIRYYPSGKNFHHFKLRTFSLEKKIAMCNCVIVLIIGATPLPNEHFQLVTDDKIDENFPHHTLIYT